MAKSIDKAQKEEDLGLNSDEIILYDALSSHYTAKNVMSDELTKLIKNMDVDGHKREIAQVKMRITVRKLLKKYGYPSLNR